MSRFATEACRELPEFASFYDARGEGVKGDRAEAELFADWLASEVERKGPDAPLVAAAFDFIEGLMRRGGRLSKPFLERIQQHDWAPARMGARTKILYEGTVAKGLPSLSIGSVVGGPTPTNKPWRDSIRAFMNRVADTRPSDPLPLNLNIVFHVSGDVVKFDDWSGARTSTYLKDEAHLMVEVALPEKPPEDPAAYLLTASHDAVNEAERWAQRRGGPIDTEALRVALDAAGTSGG